MVVIGSGSRSAVVWVKNPATGQPLAEVPSLDREATLELVGRARAAQTAWRAAGFAARGALMRDMRKWLIDNRRRVIQTLVDENGKPYEDAQLEFFYCADAPGFWAKKAPKWLADERQRPHSPLLVGRKVINGSSAGR
jgi:acyl-CoA reductase-like NAD-dependent aldehyde dehydrogenase